MDKKFLGGKGERTLIAVGENTEKFLLVTPFATFV